MEVNPYSPPKERFDATYYTTEARNATLRELWRMTPPTVGGKLLAILVKVFRLTGPPQIGFAFNGVIRCDPAEVPELVDRSSNTISELEKLGYQPALAMKTPVIGDGYVNALAFLGSEPTIFGIIVESEVRANGKVDQESGLAFLSRNATTIWPTSNMRQTLNSPPVFDTLYLTGYGTEELHDAHSERMQALAAKSLRRFTHDTLWNTLRENESLIQEFYFDRGIFRPMTMAEIESVSQHNTR